MKDGDVEMNLLMYIDFVLPLQFSRAFNYDIEKAREYVLNSLSDETLNQLSEDEKKYLGIVKE